MYSGLLHLHNLMRWVLLILLLIALYKHYAGMTGKKPFSNGDKKIGLFLMIAAHTTLLIGLYQWFAGSFGFKLIQNTGMGEVMKNSVSRFWAIEHLLGMLVAIILITIGRSVSKKTLNDVSKHKKTFWYFLIALLIMIISIPWPFREGVGRPWFPGM